MESRAAIGIFGGLGICAIFGLVCLSLLIVPSSVVMIVLGAICIGENNYAVCGGSYSGSLALLIIGCILFCCFGVSIKIGHSKRSN
jgi:hypothetical protein